MNSLNKAMENLRESKKAESDKLAKLVEKKSLKESLKTKNDIMNALNKANENNLEDTINNVEFSDLKKKLKDQYDYMMDAAKPTKAGMKWVKDGVIATADKYFNESKIIKEDKEDIDVDQAYRYLYDNFSYEIAKLAWKSLTGLQKDFWKDSYKMTFQDDEDYPNGYEGEPTEAEVFQHFYDSGNLDPETVLEDLSEKETIELAKKAGIDKHNQKLKDDEDAREAAIKKLMGTSGLSREEVLEIVNQIK